VGIRIRALAACAPALTVGRSHGAFTTRRSARRDRRWREVLDEHDAAVRRVLARMRGRELRTTGDGFLASFDRPARAIRRAKEITATVRRLGLDVRAGLHTGECEVRGADLTGLAVHIGARTVARRAATLTGGDAHPNS
jgi:class 3 adenylate cyclase